MQKKFRILAAGCALLTCTSLQADIANQSHQDLNHMPSITQGRAKAYSVPLLIASEETLKGYGRLVQNFDAEKVTIVTWPAPGWRPVVEGTGNEGGVVEDQFTMRRKGKVVYAQNDAVGRSYITGWFDDPANPNEQAAPTDSAYVYTHEANYHPDGGQVFFPTDGKPFVALLAKPGDDIKPKDFVAFYFKGDTGVQIEPGVWHQPMFPVTESSAFMNKQGAVHACIGVDFIEEFGTYLKIPLKNPKTELKNSKPSQSA